MLALRLFENGTRHLHAFAPGRTELAGNHVDHQGGTVITAAIEQGIEADAALNGLSLIRIRSEGYDDIEIDAGDVDSRLDEQMEPASIVRGVTAGFRAHSFEVRGFDTRIASSLPAGGGVSSSAAFEIALCAIMNALFADGALDALWIARIAQHAECDYFGKPCGLMDQIAIAYGGIVRIDLGDSANPRVSKIDFSFEDAGYAVCLVDVGSDHSRNTAEYARVPQDMFGVARLCGAPVLGDVDENVFMDRLPMIRRKLGDRAALRGLHFFKENELSKQRAEALSRNDIERFLACTRESAISSAQYLQNVFCEAESQPAMVALALSDRALHGRGASRIHGGGFGGSIQAFVPLDMIGGYRKAMEDSMGEGSCRVLKIRSGGAVATWE